MYVIGMTRRDQTKFTRREFIGSIGLGAAIAPFAARVDRDARVVPPTPFPFVDGLTFMPPPAHQAEAGARLADVLGAPNEIAASGLSAFLLDVSDGRAINTSDGSIKFWRDFDGTAKKIADTRESLARDWRGSAFHATRGSEISEAHRTGRTAVFFQIQGGGEAVGEDLSRLDALYASGLRVFQITHHNDNLWGGGCIQERWTGLTKLGRDGVKRLNALGIIPDLSHVADPTSRDVLKATKKPVIISHGAARAFVNSARCVPDDVIKGVADSGGAMGIFMMTCWLTNDPVPTSESYLRQIRHVINVGGIDAVGIAND